MKLKDSREPRQAPPGDPRDVVVILRARPWPSRASMEASLRAMQEAKRIAASRARAGRSKLAVERKTERDQALARRVRSLIRLRGLSDRAIADHLEVDRRDVARVRREQLGLTPADVQRIRDGL